MPDFAFLTTEEYAQLRRCSVRTVERERANGDGCPYVRLGSRILYRRADIDRWIEQHVHSGALTSAQPPSSGRSVRMRP